MTLTRRNMEVKPQRWPAVPTAAAAAAAAAPPRLYRASRLDVGLALQPPSPPQPSGHPACTLCGKVSCGCLQGSRCFCCGSLEVRTSTGSCNPRCPRLQPRPPSLPPHGTQRRSTWSRSSTRPTTRYSGCCGGWAAGGACCGTSPSRSASARACPKGGRRGRRRTRRRPHKLCAAASSPTTWA